MRDTLNEGSVSVKWVDTKNNPADVFTKNISREVVEHLMPILSGRAELPEAPAVAPLVTRQAEPTAVQAGRAESNHDWKNGEQLGEARKPGPRLTCR